MNKILTISRQYSSGGREIGQKLAEIWGIPFYDNELITRAAEESGNYTDPAYLAANEHFMALHSNHSAGRNGKIRVAAKIVKAGVECPFFRRREFNFAAGHPCI